MPTLYRGFALLIFTFIILFTYTQIVLWKRGSNVITFTNENAVGLFMPKVVKPSRGGRSTRIHDNVKYSLTSQSKITSSLSNSAPRISVWNASADSDRILEQIEYIPQSFKQREVKERKPKVILVSNSPESWGKKIGGDSFIDDACLIRNCVLVDGAYAHKVDAILFYSGVPHPNEYAKNVKPETVKIFFALESPYVFGISFGENGYINWTATYRRDSTIVAPYEKFSLFPNASIVARLNKKQPRNVASGKTKMAAIFVSNCGSQNGRLDTVRELQRYIPVDVYGQCGSLQCPRYSREKCFQFLNDEYKFYLAFENANCRDYITEKFFVNGLQNNVIPIVMGAHPDDYRKVAPPHSYIHVEDFRTIRDLANRMKQLNASDEKYNEYFHWKGTGSFVDTKFFCRVCSLLNDDGKPRLVVDDLEHWWGPRRTCRSGRWLPDTTRS